MVVVAATLVRFEVALAKSDLLGDGDSSTGAKRTRDTILAKEARLTTSRDMMVVAMAKMASYGVVTHGAPALAVGGASGAKADDADALVKEHRLF